MIKKIKKICIALALVFVCLLSCFPFGALKAFADGIQVDGGYTGVLDDLRKDESFDEMQYPIVENDYTLQVIQIAESVDKELFVYVYQPNAEHGKYVASTINISATDDNSLDIMNYPLSFVNYDGVFQKYLVTGLTLPTGTTRYYEVISIFRKFDESLGDVSIEEENGNTISEVSYRVGKLFIIATADGATTVSVFDTETIKITSKYVGFVRYEAPLNGIMGFTDYYDRHFVAFSTDKKIDKLLEADVFYMYQEYTYNKTGFITYQDELTTPEARKAELKDTDTGSYEEDNVFWKTEFEWYRISTIDSFLGDVDKEHIYNAGIVDAHQRVQMTEEGMNDLRGKEWVLSFTETSYSQSITTDWVKYNYAVISDVSILRLKFETDGVVYNLGVIDNKQTGDGIPDGTLQTTFELNDWFKIIMAVLLVILLFVVLGPVLPIVFKIIGFILKLALKIITAPFRFIGWLFRKR